GADKPALQPGTRCRLEPDRRPVPRDGAVEQRQGPGGGSECAGDRGPGDPAGAPEGGSDDAEWQLVCELQHAGALDRLLGQGDAVGDAADPAAQCRRGGSGAGAAAGVAAGSREPAQPAAALNPRWLRMFRGPAIRSAPGNSP